MDWFRTFINKISDNEKTVFCGSSVEDIRCKAPLKIKNRTVRFVKAKI
jgi:hypothetical protein